MTSTQHHNAEGCLVAMKTRVTFSISKYQTFYGHSPKGTANWHFQLGPSGPDRAVVSVFGPYAKACRRVAQMARQRGYDTVTVTP